MVRPGFRFFIIPYKHNFVDIAEPTLYNQCKSFAGKTPCVGADALRSLHGFYWCSAVGSVRGRFPACRPPYRMALTVQPAHYRYASTGMVTDRNLPVVVLLLCSVPILLLSYQNGADRSFTRGRHRFHKARVTDAPGNPRCSQ